MFVFFFFIFLFSFSSFPLFFFYFYFYFFFFFFLFFFISCFLFFFFPLLLLFLYLILFLFPLLFLLVQACNTNILVRFTVTQKALLSTHLCKRQSAHAQVTVGVPQKLHHYSILRIRVKNHTILSNNFFPHGAEAQRGPLCLHSRGF